MLQLKPFYHKLLCGMSLFVVAIATANADLPTFEQLAGTWQSNDHNDQFTINTGGMLSGLKVPEIDGKELPNIQIDATDNTFTFAYSNTGTACDSSWLNGWGKCEITDGRGTFSSATTVTYTYHYRIDPCYGATAVCTEEVRDADGSKTATKGVPPGGLSLSPTTLPFGNQTVNTTSVAKTVTLKNNSTTTVASNITVTFPAKYERLGGNCTATLAANAECTIGVIFKPTAVGVSNGNLSITSSLNATPITAQLTGTGIPVIVLSASPTSLDFGNQTVNTTSVPKTVTLKNNSTTTVASNITVTFPAKYERLGGNCTATLAANAECTIGVIFKPTAVGVSNGNLSITSSLNATPITVQLTGVGNSVVLSLTPTSLNFGNQTVNTTSTVRIVTLTKTGTAATDLTVNATGNYAVSGGTCGNTFNTASCTIGIIFRPTALGTNDGTLTVAGTGANTVNATLTGIGTAVTPPTPPPAGVTSVPVFGLPGLWILTMLLTSVVGMVGFRKQS